MTTPPAEYLPETFRRGIHSGNFTFWWAMIEEVLRAPNQTDRVLDIGCGEGGFLRLLRVLRSFDVAIGIDVDPEQVRAAEAALLEDEANISYRIADVTDPKLLQSLGQFELLFMQEVFWQIKDLPALARSMFSATADLGECYATCGCHVENPLWEHRRRRLKAEGVTVYDHSLDEIADAFHGAGFEVGMKRLPARLFKMFHPEFTRDRAISLSRLVDATEDHKMLLLIRRDDEWHERQALGRGES